MTCEECGGDEAVVHLTQVVNNEMSVVHLCEACAAAKGLEAGGEPASPLSDFIAQMGGAPPRPAGADTACPFCGLTYADFKEVGRLGCAECWTTFQDPLEKLVRRVHGSSQHLGKVYLPPDPSATDLRRRMEGLRHRLNRAVEAEDFERAAQLRDQIRTLESRT
ncbi:MAG: UvrB/UvrC motif-containing protein [Longimicrobiales bacterium]|nr:UvrB/UvrC motif-containing protein [Longimicrobiales bacterium]